jgi:CarD family transcriptional regulator
MRILDTDMTIMVPVDGTKNAGLRYVIDPFEAAKVFEILREKARPMIIYPGTGVQRLYGEDKSGSIFEVAMVLRELYSLRSWKGLSLGEKKMFEMARNLIKKELSIALDKGEER